MNFLNLNILWNLLWVVPLFIVAIILASSKRKKVISSMIGMSRNRNDYTDVSHTRRVLRNWLFVIAAAFVFLAAARPYWGHRIMPFNASGRDILVVLDVSNSMLSKDIPPTRLDHARLMIKQLITDTPGDRYGIIVFAGTAFTECPLTDDRSSLFNILGNISTNSIPVGGTNIENALRQALTAFKAAEGSYKAIVLFTDGDELQGNSDNVINDLKHLKIPMIAVGIGDPDKPGLIQLSDDNGKNVFMRDSNGELVKTKLNEEQLKKLALATGGTYIRSTATDPGTKSLLSKVKTLLPEKYNASQISRPLERFQIPLLFAILLFLCWFSIGERRRK